jgi:hypothetical protein
MRAFQLADVSKMPNRFNKEKKQAGKEWLNMFLTRHPEISIQTPEPTSITRAMGFNRSRVAAFF